MPTKARNSNLFEGLIIRLKTIRAFLLWENHSTSYQTLRWVKILTHLLYQMSMQILRSFWHKARTEELAPNASKVFQVVPLLHLTFTRHKMFSEPQKVESNHLKHHCLNCHLRSIGVLKERLMNTQRYVRIYLRSLCQESQLKTFSLRKIKFRLLLRQLCKGFKILLASHQLEKSLRQAPKKERTWPQTQICEQLLSHKIVMGYLTNWLSILMALRSAKSQGRNLIGNYWLQKLMLKMIQNCSRAELTS